MLLRRVASELHLDTLSRLYDDQETRIKVLSKSLEDRATAWSATGTTTVELLVSLWNTFPSMIRFVVIMVLVKAGSEVRDSFWCVKYDSPLIKKNHWSVVGAVFLVYLTLALGIIYKEMLTFNSSTILNSSHNIRTSYINWVPLNFPLVSRIPSPQCRCVFRSSRADRKSWSRDCRRIWSTAEPRQREYVNNGELCGDILCWMIIDWLIDGLMDGWMVLFDVKIVKWGLAHQAAILSGNMNEHADKSMGLGV